MFIILGTTKVVRRSEMAIPSAPVGSRSVGAILLLTHLFQFAFRLVCFDNSSLMTQMTFFPIREWRPLSSPFWVYKGFRILSLLCFVDDVRRHQRFGRR